MFNRYFRTYPWVLQLLLYVLMVFTMMSFITLLQLSLLPKFLHIPLTELSNITKSSSRAAINASLLVQAFSHASLFLIPALLWAYLTHPRPMEYLGLRRPGKSLHWLLIVGVILGLLPIMMALEQLMHLLPLGAWADNMQKQNTDTAAAYLNPQSPLQFVAVLFVIAVLPALGEELTFRGIIMRLAQRRTRSITISILFSAALFAIIHFSPYGLLPIFLAGVVLAGIYYLTGSLWCSILAHFLNNGLQVAVYYLGRHSKALQTIAESDSLPAAYTIVGILLFAGCGYLLWKNRTPLSSDWAEDFTPEEKHNIQIGNN